MSDGSYRSAKVFVRDSFAGILKETDNGYLFKYDKGYLEDENAVPVSLTLPLREEAYESVTIFSFFDGLIPEGWLLERIIRNWKLNPRDRFGLLMVSCKDPIGCVSVEEYAS